MNLNQQILNLIKKGYTDLKIMKRLKITRWKFYAYTTTKERKIARKLFDKAI